MVVQCPLLKTNHGWWLLAIVLLFPFCIVKPVYSQEFVDPVPITALAIAPDQQTVVIGSQARLRCLSWPDLVVQSDLTTELTNVHDLKFSPDGKWLLAAGGTPAESGRLEIWAWPQRKRVRQLKLHDDLVYRVAWSLDSRFMATASIDSFCCVCDMEEGQVRMRFDGHSKPVLAIRFFDSETLISAGVDQTIRIWKTDGTLRKTLDNHVGTVSQVVISSLNKSLNGKSGFLAPDARMFSISHDRTVRLWNPSSGRMVRFARLPATPVDIAVTPDNNRLVVASNDGQIRLLDANTLETIQVIPAGVGYVTEMRLIVQNDGKLLGLAAGELGLNKLEFDE